MKDIKEMVKYDNLLNKLPLSGLNAIELDLFMALCAKAKGKGHDLIILKYADLKKLLDMSKQNDTYFHKKLQEMCARLKKIDCSTITDDDDFLEFNLFSTFAGSLKSKELRVRVNEDLEFLLNDVSSFTVFELRKFVVLKSKYSKNLFRLLKQYNNTGVYRISAEELRKLLDCPGHYPNKEFIRACLKPSMEELSSCFADLKVNPIRGSGRGRPIQEYRFTFKPVKPARESKDPSIPPKQKPRQRKNSFNNFTQRNYDFAEYERMVLTGGKEEST